MNRSISTIQSDLLLVSGCCKLEFPVLGNDDTYDLVTVPPKEDVGIALSSTTYVVTSLYSMIGFDEWKKWHSLLRKDRSIQMKQVLGTFDLKIIHQVMLTACLRTSTTSSNMLPSSAYSLFLILRLCLSLDPSRPNFVFILTDDQDVVFESMDYMPFTKDFFESNGMTFTNSFIATPICCPSRTESITGRGFQNIRQKPVDCMDISAKFNVFNNTQSMFQMFHGHGYDTSTFGKLTNNMNKYFCEHSPPFTDGFDRIHCPCNYNDFYGTEYMNYYPNGTVTIDLKVPLTPKLYETSMVGNATIEYLSQIIADPNHNRPFMTWIGLHAPHYPADPADWYKGICSQNISVLSIQSLSLNTHFVRRFVLEFDCAAHSQLQCARNGTS